MIARQLSFFAPAAVLSAWATVMLHTIATGHINRLLSPLFRNYVLIAAVLLFILSALYLLFYQPHNDTAPALAPTGRLRQFGRWLMLLVPLVAASILSPSALSSTTLVNRGLGGSAPMPSWNAASEAKAKEALDADPNQPVPVEVTDLLTLSRSPEQIKAFEGRRIRTVGLFVAQAGGTPKLVRWIMWCCAADAQPASVELSGDTSGDWKDTQWLEVIGKAQFPTKLGKVTPEIVVESIKPTVEPDEPYLSP
jgi:uncharacterized repeat protein (TIGR03943 family)